MPAIQAALPGASNAGETRLSLAWRQGRRAKGRAQWRLSDGAIHWRR